jgi:phosphoglycerate dehydrogenase-like enzyme
MERCTGSEKMGDPQTQTMNKLRIFADFAAPADALEILRTGTAGHELLLSRTPASSVLAKAGHDPQLSTADVAFGQPDPQAIAAADKLQWIHISSSGIERYDNREFRALVAARKIEVSNSASVYNEACAVHALSFILAQARQLPLALQSRPASGTAAWHELRKNSGTLRGETVLILGYGAIGKRLSELLAPLGMKVTAYRRRPRGNEGVPVITENSLADALGKADHVVNILPSSSETRCFFNRQRFASFGKGAIFYNIGRGATVDQDALVEALRSGQVSAAWLDVTDPEPLPDGHPLLEAPHCFVTPHIAGGHLTEAASLVSHFLSNLDRFARKEPLLDRVM